MNAQANKEPVFLVDGSSYIHRAYHAIRNLSNSKGFPTNVVFGFTKMLLKLLQEKNPKYVAIVFDAKGPTFRHEVYKEYKANRPPMPEDLAVQIPLVKRVIEALNIKILEMEGYEADDIIGTLARKCQEQSHEVVMVTGDKDFRQLVTPKAIMWDTMKDKITDYESIKADYGLEPEQFIDVMGLSGDASDNIPGVPGIGEKTAVKLIKEFGSLENVLEKVEEVKGKKLQENLRQNTESALLSKKLVTIDQEVPLDIEIQDLIVGQPNRQVLSELFRELEFRDLWDQFTVREQTEEDYRVCWTEADLERLIAQIKEKGMVCLDTETTSENPFRAKLVGISFCLEEGKAIYLPLGHEYAGAPAQISIEDALEALKPVFEDGDIKKIGQNIKYDAEVLRFYNISLAGIHFDTMVASYVINPGLRQHNLEALSQQYLNHKMISYSDVVGKGKKAKNFSQVKIEAAAQYSCEDADITFRLMRVLSERLKAEKNEDLFYGLEMKLIPVLMDMELAGIRIDVDFFEALSAKMARELEQLEEEIYKEAGMKFNINSPQQLGHVLFEKLQLPTQRKTTKTKRYSTDVRVLKKLAVYPHKVPKLVLRYRTLSKLKSTYLDALVKMVEPRTGRLHTSFNQTVTATGRLSSSNPNLQNIPIRGDEGKEIRKGFIADKGCKFISADYSQIELRVFAHYSGDPAFKEAFERGEDIHTKTASEIMGVSPDKVTPDMRRIAKAINFGIIYGMGPQKLSEELEIDLSSAKQYIATYYERYKGVLAYKERMIKEAKEKGYVTTLFNRRRYVPDIEHPKQVIRAEAERIAVNTPIQGTAADLIKKAMINLHARLRREGYSTRMLLQVHDELLFEAPEAEVESVIPVIKGEMENVYRLDVPLKVDIGIGMNWSEAH
ncbi:MAG: DNA polymerase I [Deltaproteobacteria bacterium]|nr:MAG: DNA polymerase I [Deltaproteobacteria bacterium]